MATKRSWNRSWLIGVGFGLIYGVVARIFFGMGNFYGAASDAFATMSVTFIFLVPLTVGALAVWFSPSEGRTSWSRSVRLALGAVGVGCLAAGILAYEAWICILMALPLMLLLGGGVA